MGELKLKVLVVTVTSEYLGLYPKTLINLSLPYFFMLTNLDLSSGKMHKMVKSKTKKLKHFEYNVRETIKQPKPL